jgi:hypothetical protein
VRHPAVGRQRDHQSAVTAVSVNTPYQVVHEGVVYGPGQTADVPEEIARKWLEAGWVSEATQPEKRATKAAPPKWPR